MTIDKTTDEHKFPDLDDAATYVMERMGVVDDRIVIEGRITELYVSWQLKRGEYNSEEIRGHMKIAPDNLVCDFIVDKVGQKVMEARGSHVVAGEVFRVAARELDLRCLELMTMHNLTIHNETKTKEDRVQMGTAIESKEKAY